MALVGKIVIGPHLTRTGNSILIQSDNFSTAAARDSWLDTHDISTHVAGSSYCTTSVQMRCYKIDTIAGTEVQDGATMIAGSGADAVALDRSTRSSFQPIIVGLWGQSNNVGHGLLTQIPTTNYPQTPTR